MVVEEEEEDVEKGVVVDEKEGGSYEAYNQHLGSALTASYSAMLSLPMLPLGVSPRPPTSPAQRSLRMSPYRFGITRTSN